MQLHPVAVVLALAAIACGGETNGAAGGGGAASGGAGSGGGIACGELEILDGDSCLRVGVAVCPDGFASDEDGGCSPTLPASPCPPGEMALPGEAACRPIMDCGAGTWGEIPVDATTTYVDQSYAGVDPSDGTAARPYTTITEGMDAVAPGGLVAVAAGHYLERLFLDIKMVRLWGRCPAMVRVTGDNPSLEGTVQISVAEPGQEVHGLRIDGPGFGVTLSGAEDVMLDRLWVTETAQAGIAAEDVAGPASFTLQDSLVEETAALGVSLGGTTGIVERSEIRRIPPGPGGIGAAVGLVLRTAAPAVTVRRSLLQGSVGAGIGSLSGSITVEDSAILDVAPIAATLLDGIGVAVQRAPNEPAEADVRVTLSGTTVARVHEVGVLVIGVPTRLERVTVNDVFPQAADDVGGVGFGLQQGDLAAESMVVTEASITDTPGFGISVADASVTVDRSIMRRAQPLASEDLFGDGIVVASFDSGAELTFSRSMAQDNSRAGLSNFAASVSVSASRFDCNAVDLDGEITEFGDFTFVDAGDNRCGCGDEETACKVASANLQPPAPP